jgi:hypothetical protein
VSDAWAEYFAGPVPPAGGGVNWEAYSHDELYQMLWQDADVADVSTVATEWARHRVALTTHAEVLREQCAALRDSWQGPGADEAVSRLEALAARVEKISELAHVGGQAAQEAADALAMARAMMPPPPGNPAAPLTNAMTGVPAVPAFSTAPDASVPVVPAAPDSSSTASLQSYLSSMQDYLSSMQQSFSSALTSSSSEMFTPAPVTTASSATPADMGTAFGAVDGGGYSFYVGSVGQDQQKAQAVRAMQTYESSLTSSSQMLGDARGAVPAADPLSTTVAGSTSPAQGGAGVPWQRLVGSAPGGLRAGGGTGTVVGGPGAAAKGASLGPGVRVGSLPGVVSGSGMQAARLAETAAARAAGQGGMAPPVGSRGTSADDEQHENQLPTLDHGLFDVEVPTVAPVIGGQA